MKRMIRHVFFVFVRWIGRQVCRVKGHNYYYAGGVIDTCCAYSCVRCGELDRPLDSLPPRPEGEYWDDPNALIIPDDDYIAMEYERERRWISCLRFPKWI